MMGGGAAAAAAAAGVDDDVKQPESSNCPPPKEILLNFLLCSIPEFFATLLFTFMGGAVVFITGSIVNDAVTSHRVLTVAITDGFMYYGFLYMAMKLSYSSSGFLNPAVTTSVALLNIIMDWRDSFALHIFRTLFYFTAQIGGAVLGTIMLYAVVPNAMKGHILLGAIHVGEGQAFFITTILSFFLMFVIFAVRGNEGRMSSLLICFTYIGVRLVSYPITGGYLNPARSIAQYAMWDNTISAANVWVDVIGSIVGCALAAPFYLLWHKRDEDADAPPAPTKKSRKQRV